MRKLLYDHSINSKAYLLAGFVVVITFLTHKYWDMFEKVYHYLFK